MIYEDEPLAEERFNGAMVLHRNADNCFADPDSGDRIWINDIDELDLMQVIAYEEPDGMEGDGYVSVVALDWVGILKLHDHLDAWITRYVERLEKRGEA